MSDHIDREDPKPLDNEQRLARQLFGEKKWDRCRRKTKPQVKREVRGGGGRVVRKRGIEDMLNVFKRRVRKSGRLKEKKRRRHYEKPSTKRREAKKEREYKIEKENKRRKAERRIRRRGERPIP